MYNDIYHHGIKGQKWGVRNGPPYPLDENLNTYKIHGDGRIEIKKGTKIQRLVGKMSKQTLDGVTYASFTNNDNARYMHGLNNKALGAMGIHDIKLNLTAKVDLKSPSNDDATKEFFTMLKENPKIHEAYAKTDFMSAPSNKNGEKYSNKELDDILKDVSGIGKDHYYLANASLLLDSMKPVREEFFSRLQKKGYNMLHDVNDAWSGVSKNPIVIFDGSKSLNMESKTFVDKKMVKQALKYDKETIKLARKWLQKNGFREDVLLE